MTRPKYKFPDDFFWGASTSAHQVEGGLTNDWTRWEEENCQKLAVQARSGHYSASQKRQFPEMFKPANYLSGKACRHFQMFETDFDLARKLGHNAHRFSIDWSRIEPTKGIYDRAAIKHYRRVLQVLKKRQLEPFVTFYHWPLPIWLADIGGWENPSITDYFTKYCQTLAHELGDHFNFIITINEPMVFSSHGYQTGQWPPGVKNLWRYYRVVNNLIAAHQRSYLALKDINTGWQIGIAKQNTWFEAYQDKILNRALKAGADWWFNDRFLSAINQYQDFIGLNHYFRHRINYGFNKNPNRRISDLGWELYPPALYHALIELKKYQKPIYITENGLADAKDNNRQWFIRQSLRSVWRSIQEGVDVRGYLHWSLLDNFEWSYGFWPRFGLVEVDYHTMKRTPRPSARWYEKVCRENGFN